MENSVYPKRIVFVDDESYEADLLKFSCAKLDLKYDIIYFSRSADAYRYLEETRDHIFMVISDVGMPEMSGLQLKKKIDSSKSLAKKSIPFVFYSNSVKQEEVDEAYEMNIQGYFQKPMSTEQMTELISIIVKYWEFCFHPTQ